MFSNQQETRANSKSASLKSESSSMRGRRRSLLAWLMLASFLPLSVLLITYGQQGFVAAGRAATSLVLPAGLVWLILWALTAGAAVKKCRKSLSLWLVLFLIWTVVGNEKLAAFAIGWVESPIPTSVNPAFEQRDRGDRVDAIVTLGGCTELVAEGFPEMTEDGERLVSAAQAYHAGMTSTIITTGSSTDGIGDPGELGRALLISLGVPADRVFRLEGVNTMAEMQSLADFLHAPPPSWQSHVDAPDRPRIGLITSAFHMPRAMRLAREHDLDLVPLPCAFRRFQTERPWKASDCVPTADSQKTFGKAIKEAIAWVVGR